MTARTGEPYLRVYTEEKDRTVWLLVDQRITMFFGSRWKMKSVTAAETASAAAWRVLSQGDRVGAIVFGDLADPQSRVSVMTAERGGMDLMPEMGYRPTNKYLPPRPRRDGTRPEAAPAALPDAAPEGGFLAWLDRVLAE